MKQPLSVKRYEMIAIQMLYAGASAGFIYPNFIIQSTEGAYWIPLAIWTAGALASSFLYSRLLARLDGGNMIARIQSALGTWGASLLAAPVLLFLIIALVIMLRAYTEMITMTILPTTPISFLNGMLLAPAALAFAGMMPIVRAARIFFLLGFLFTFCLLLIGLSDVKWVLGMPWMRTNGDFLRDKGFYAGSFLWMGFAITSFIGTYTRSSAQSAWKSYAFSLLCAFPFIASYIYLPVMTFGRELSQRLTFPFISKMDTITHYWLVFENLTAIFVSAIMFYLLLIMALKLHAIGEMMKIFMPRANKKILYTCLSLIVYAAATAIPSWRTVENMILLTFGCRFYVMFFFPLLGMLALAYGKKKLEAGE
ncbi:GerAB/ArcD/ProY family transporter [Paenibacillus sp. HB172176]|uniref:GerAB/ArcD/ProY family transporter n=1 Tax=Paenibacillus sp. HB172176 TaxID=2493690 RepID=UPI00143B3E96|nr:GerAB/ArcD/ProY family transporter [Paenibacillus sp. HB172176]